MNLNEYLKKIGYSIPKLSKVYNEYSPLFKEYYEFVKSNFTTIEDDDSGKSFMCFKWESKEYFRKIEQNEYLYKDWKTIATIENVQEVRNHFNDGFNDGFGDVEFQPYLTRNIIDNIVYRDYFTHGFFGIGINRFHGHSNEQGKDLLVSNHVAYKEGYTEGKRFKSYFLYVEFYDQFKNLPEPFIRPIKYYHDERSYGIIHYTEDKDFDLKKVMNIESTDSRLITTQNQNEIVDFFKIRLSDWYSNEDIEHFLKANFKCFEDKRTPKILASNQENIKGLQHKLFGWTYEFYQNEGEAREKKVRFAEMLKNNFDAFSNPNLSTINKAIRNYQN